MTIKVSAEAQRRVLADLDGRLFASVPETAMVLRSDRHGAAQHRGGRHPGYSSRPRLARAGHLAAQGGGAGNERGRSLTTGLAATTSIRQETGLNVPRIGAYNHREHHRPAIPTIPQASAPKARDRLSHASSGGRSSSYGYELDTDTGSGRHRPTACRAASWPRMSGTAAAAVGSGGSWRSGSAPAGSIPR